MMLTVKKIQVKVKGGPSSGFHGHAGRRGKRGGSASRGSIVTGIPSYEQALQLVEAEPGVRVEINPGETAQQAIQRYESAMSGGRLLPTDNPSEAYIRADSVPLKQMDLMNFAIDHMKDMDPDSAAKIIKELQFFGAANKDIDGLEKISTDPPNGFIAAENSFSNVIDPRHMTTMPEIGITGSYLSNIINIHPSSIQAVLCHEVGHHVGDKFGFEEYKKSQLMSMLDKLRRTKVFTIQELGLSVNATKNRYELFAEAYEAIKQSLAWIRLEKKAGITSSSFGLKQDFMKHQLDKLRKAMAEHSLDDVFDALSS